jgi:putative hydrolase of the HAD superfamily
MPAPANAILFDLDETLYPERRYAISGFRAVARTMQSRTGVPAARSFGILVRAFAAGRRGCALQELCAAEGWPEQTVTTLVDVIRDHTPSLRLPRSSRGVLAGLRPDWRVGIVTNGRPAVQRAKVAALGLAAQVDAVVLAAEHGSGRGKPDPEPFLAAAAALGVDAQRCVFVGDDPFRDVHGARRLGMKTIRIRRGPYASVEVPPSAEADAVIDCISDVPGRASALARERR